MKNIFVLPTDKPSKLHLIEDTFKITEKYKNSVCDTEVNIYITSDEKIEEGDLVIRYNEQPILITPDFFWDFGVKYYKIILTTDPKLIADGVQEINDEFLEWFIKNPTCEFVDIKHFGSCCGNQSITQCINCKKYNHVYKITIPHKESKQETLEEDAEKYSEEHKIPIGMKYLMLLDKIEEEAKKKYKKYLKKFKQY